MKTLCFLIEREHPPSSDGFLTQARLLERLTVRALFWCPDTESHTLDVVAHAPDDTRVTVGRLTRSCEKAPGLLAMEFRLHPLGAAGWHRLHLVLDDRDL